MKQLNISINPHHYNNDAEIVIAGGADTRCYILHTNDIKSEQDLRTLLSSEADHVYNAVVGMLKEMAA